MLPQRQYSETLPCGGLLLVWHDTWEIKYSFPGPDRRYNPTVLSIVGADVPHHIEALSKNLRRFEQLKSTGAFPGQAFQIEGEFEMTIRVGGPSEGVCLAGFHMPIRTRSAMRNQVKIYQYAIARAKEAQALLRRL